MHAALIIPALNEQECIAATLAGIPAGMFRYVIVADNGSTARTEADLVLGSRPLGNPAPKALLPHQAFGNWLACTLIRIIYRHRYTDLGPFRAIRRTSLESLAMRDRNYGWTIEMQIRALQKGLRVIEVPVSYGVRRAGVNKVSGHLRSSLQAGWIIVAKVFALR